MAKSIPNTAMLFNLVVVIIPCFLLFISAAESRSSKVVVDPKASSSVPSCDAVFGVRSGDTCFGIAELFGLTTEFFESINPSINCDALFVGQ